MAIYRDLNEPLADWLAKRLSEKATETSPTGVKDLGSTGDVVWTEGGETKSVKDMAAEVADLLEQGLKTEHNTVSTNSPSSTDGFHDGEWWTQIAAADDTTVTGLWRMVDGEWVAQSIPDGGLVAPYADIGLMSVAMLSAKIITSGYFRTAASGERLEMDAGGLRGYDATRNRMVVNQFGMGVWDEAGKTVFMASRDGVVAAGELAAGSLADGQLGVKIGRDPLNSSRYGLYFAKPPGFSSQPAMRYSVAEGLMQLEGGNGGRVWFSNDAGVVGGVGMWAPGQAQVHGTSVALRRFPDTNPASAPSAQVTLDDRGVNLDGYLWTKQVITDTSTYATLSSFPPGRYDIRMNHPATPNGQWGLLEVEFIASNNRLYLYRTDLGQVWSKTYANGSFTDWKRLDGGYTPNGVFTPNAGWTLTNVQSRRAAGSYMYNAISTPTGNAPAGEHWVQTANSDANALGAGMPRVVGSWIAIGNNSLGGACVWDFATGRIYLHTSQQINANTGCQMTFNFVTTA